MEMLQFRDIQTLYRNRGEQALAQTEVWITAERAWIRDVIQRIQTRASTYCHIYRSSGLVGETAAEQTLELGTLRKA